MNPDNLKAVLRKLKSGKVSLQKAMRLLSSLPYVDLDVAKIDTHRTLRKGYPEVILASRKSFENLFKIMSIAFESRQ